MAALRARPDKNDFLIFVGFEGPDKAVRESAVSLFNDDRSDFKRCFELAILVDLATEEFPSHELSKFQMASS